MKFNLATEIARNPEDVFPWIAEPEKARLWQKNVKEGEIIRETPEKTGTSFREILEENGKRLEMIGEITGFTENESISFQLESRIHCVNITYSVRGQDDRSVLKAEWTIRWKFPMNIIQLFFGRKINRNILQQTRSEFDELKRRCEE